MKMDPRVVLGDAAFAEGNYAEALRCYRDAAKRGVTAGEHNLAVMYQEGRGVAVDFAEAARLFRRAADKGAAVSQTNLGLMYYHGQGMPQDAQAALHWIGKAAAQGFAPAEFVLGSIYDNGTLVARDVDVALDWYRRAAAKGHPQARQAVQTIEQRRFVLDEARRAGALPGSTPPRSKACFIATAACGSANAPDVALLRRYRDEVLAQSRWGSLLVDVYHMLSPPLARLIARSPMAQALVRRAVVRPMAKAAARSLLTRRSGR
jgi:hypothetical protein